ncbi:MULTISPECIES: 3-hydroxyacyl-ACP dehydratase FabZ [Uliginosibacterium]|uniref:3-hydroxyacyl-[acyl-carrier-protein] dehydratase FabZ n=1 Tax=Uliginosibacterium aquaticum TaxID=2731212 RepID=A0ABX2IEJ8_9RHOO|nr:MULTISPECIES: 3-hydroxyacyl-ACP dehydratase FabZ [Uliginosibacterium]MDO6385230.1 3-hydroxyacyl-ACP dehydratase FabZ [Uliginosibacterium sp. 31-12]NSL55026.1 3-hydroxyacyl-ACP dehydratase FabZ [Uliginosibacterium aquaticum]PLK47720.1 3-hydroxyacyl-[acyl-carrier-protein] dehydratase FabZ [Uliginosibacterium sp. TH139]
MDIHQIMKYLPHRYPFLLVDRVIEMTLGERITAIKNVTINEPFFVGHFPHSPVMPGVLIIEAMAQTAAILSFKSRGAIPDENTILYFAGIDNARFKRPVLPGDTLTFEAKLEREMRGIWKYSAIARVGDEIAAQADLMCAIKQIA